LARRFQTVLVGESSIDDTIAILARPEGKVRDPSRRPNQGFGHNRRRRALGTANIADRFLPDKAIDLIDEAGSALRLQIGSMPIEIDDLDRRISHLEIERQALSKEKDNTSHERLRHVENEVGERPRSRRYPQGAWNREKSAISRVRQLKEEQDNLRLEEERPAAPAIGRRPAQLRYGRLAQIEKDIESAEHELESVKENRAPKKKKIGEDDIARIVAKWTGIPVTKMMEGEIQKLVQMPDRLKDRVVGQDESHPPGFKRHPAQTAPG